MPGIPAVPRIALLAALILIVALALFFLPGILNFGGSTPPAGSPGASVRSGPSASLAPTVAPAPTPIVYTIKKNDTLSKIATAHGITIEELLAANPTIKNKDRISEGQQIIIPAPNASPPDTIGGSAGP
jgi:LysM repeat protein